MCPAEYSMRQKKKNVYHMGLMTRVGAEKSLQGVTDKTFSKHYPVPPSPITCQFESNVRMNHNSIFLAGRYSTIKSWCILITPLKKQKKDFCDYDLH